MATQAEQTWSNGDYTIACICPMGVELAPVEAMLDETHSSPSATRDLNAYTLGRIGCHNVVIAVMHEIGNDAAATVATQLLNDFPSIRFSLLVGIGGGVPGDDEDSDVRLGDVVVSQPTQTFGGVVQYDLGKRLANGQFERTGYLNKPPEYLVANVQKLRAQHLRIGSEIPTLISNMLTRYPKMETLYSSPGLSHDLLFDPSYLHNGGAACVACEKEHLVKRSIRPDNDPRIHYGTIGSANAVIKDASIRDALSKDMKVLCLEMEAAGLMKNFQCLVIRGICDYADSHKNKQWQPYAAAVAAAYMKELLLIIPPTKVKHLPDISVEETQSPFQLGLHFQDAPLIDSDLFVGRQAEMAKMEDVLKPQQEVFEQRVLVLGGIGGIGKTQLAINYAKRHHNTYESVFWLNATSETTVGNGIRGMAQSILNPEEFEACDHKQIVLRVRRWLSQRGNNRWLLIFDNYDEPQAYHLSNYYPMATHGSIIVTTRLPDRVVGTVFHVPALANVEDSLQVLETRSQRQDIGKDAHARLLAERFQGLPLALATAGAYLKKNTLTFQQYLNAYETRWNINPRRPVNLPEYKDRTLFTTWDLSFSLLEREDPEAVRLLKLLAYFDNQRIWYQLFRAGIRQSSPPWIVELTVDEIAFQNVAEVLVDYCFLEIQTGPPSFYSVHACIHDWIRTSLNSKIDEECYWYAFECVAHLIRDSVDTRSLSMQTFVPLVPHAVRLADPPQPVQLGEVNALLSNRFRDSIRVANLLKAHDQYDASDRLLQRSLEYLEQNIGNTSQVPVDLIYLLGFAYNTIGKPTEAEKVYQIILAREHSTTPTVTIYTLKDYALLCSNQGRFAEAERMYNLALKKSENEFGENHYTTLAIVHLFGRLYQKQGRLSDAESMYTRASQARESTSGLYKPATLESLYYLGWIYRLQNRVSEARLTLERVLVGEQEIFGRDHRTTLRTALKIADLHLYYLGDLDAAEGLFRHALLGFTEIRGRSDRQTLDVARRLAAAYKLHGKLDQAEQLLSSSLIHSEEDRGECEFDTLATAQDLASVYASQGQLKKAERMYDRVIAGHEKALILQSGFWQEHASKLVQVIGMRLKLAEAGPDHNRTYIRRTIELARKYGSTTYEQLGRVLASISDDSNATKCFLRSVSTPDGILFEIETICDGCNRYITQSTGRNICRQCTDTDLCDECFGRYDTSSETWFGCKGHTYFTMDFSMFSNFEGQDQKFTEEEEAWLVHMLETYSEDAPNINADDSGEAERASDSLVIL